MATVLVVRLVGCGTQPEVVVKIVGNGLGIQMLLTYPEELPVEAGVLGHCHGEGPAKQTAVNQLLERSHLGAETVEGILKAEPGVKTENSVVAFHRLNNSLTLTNGTGHGLFAPYILTGLCSLYRHDCMPVGRGTNVHYVHVGIMDQVHEVVIAGYLSESCLFSHVLAPSQPGLIYIANCNQTVGHVKVVAAADTAEADDTLGELVAGGNVTFTAEHVARQDGERSHSRCSLEELSSACHVFYCYLTDIKSVIRYFGPFWFNICQN